jgi:hypothetical protein
MIDNQADQVTGPEFNMDTPPMELIVQADPSGAQIAPMPLMQLHPTLDPPIASVLRSGKQ